MTNKEMIKKYNLDINNSTTFNNYYTIELKVIKKELKAGTKVTYVTIKEEFKEIDFEKYYNIIASTNFFKSLGGKESITKGYTVAGYLPTRLLSISPNGATKKERIFTIKSK